jgi:hypothetical protein
VAFAASTTPSVVADATETELADVSHCAASKPVFAPQGRRKAGGEQPHFFSDMAREIGLRIRLSDVPHAQRGLRHVEDFAQARADGFRQRVRIALGDHADRPAVELRRDAVVLVPVAQQFGEPAFELLVLVAQHFHLAFLQRHRRLPVRIRKPDGAEQFSVLGEEIGVVEQIIGDFAFVHGFGLVQADSG